MADISKLSPDGGTNVYDLKDAKAQPKTLSSPITVQGETKTTVEDTLNALNHDVVSKMANGLAPQLPNETTTTKFLRQDGTWEVPPNDNTDTNVTQTNSTANNDFRVLLSANANDTTETTTAKKSTNLKFNPSMGILNSTKIVASSTQAASGLADNKPALIVGGASTSAHLELDSNQVMAKSDGTTPTELFINKDGGQVTVGDRLVTKGQKNFITGSGTAGSDKGSGVSPRYFPALWTFNLGHTPVEGEQITIKTPVAGHDNGVFVSIDNGTTYYPVRFDYSTTRLSKQFVVSSIIEIVYTPNATVNDVYSATGGDTRENITGCWTILNQYDTDIRPAAYCNTAAGTAAKVASCTDFSLADNSYLFLTLVNSNTKEAKITLNVNGTGAKDIYINGTVSSDTNYTLPAGTYIVYFSSNKYYFRTDGKITTSGVVDIWGNTTKYAKGDGTFDNPIGTLNGTDSYDILLLSDSEL